MNTDAMLRLTLENGGGTFSKDGSPITAKFGYVVGIHTGTFEVVSLDNVDLFGEAVRNVIREYPRTDMFVGTWLTGGEIHIDPVIVTFSRKFALKIAKMTNQKAIYDLETGETIDVE